MAKRRTRSKRITANRAAQNKAAKIAKAAALVAFTADEEEFFRAGDSIEYLEALDTVTAANDQVATERPSLWRRLFARATLAA